MKTQNINLYVVLLCLGTQTLCGRNKPPKHDANLTFYVPGLKPEQTIFKCPQIQYLVLQYDENTKYKFIGRSLMSRYPNPLRPK